jgi:chitinase
MKRFLSSFITIALLLSNSIFILPALAIAPVAPKISDWLVPATSTDGNISIEWNMYWGENGNRWYVNEDGNNIHEETLTPNDKQAQSGSATLNNRPGGTHSYQVFLCQDNECTGSNKVSTVIEKDGFIDASVSPETPVIAWMPAENTTGNYKITWNMWWGENGNLWKLQENGQEIHQESIVMSSPQAQEASFSINNKTTGNYQYIITLCKKDQNGSETCNKSAEKNIKVSISESGDPISDSESEDTIPRPESEDAIPRPEKEPDTIMPEQAEPIFFEQKVPRKNIFKQDLNASSKGVYTDTALDQDWEDPVWNDGVTEGRVQIAGEFGNNHYISLSFPKGEFGTKKSGAQWKVEIPKHDDVTLSYKVRFGENFDFVKGGKLPGLAGGTANTGSKKPNGSDGWSARMMWRKNGDIVQYVYHPDQSGNFGEDFPWDYQGKQSQFVPGKWHDISTRVVMNSPGKKDGKIFSWIDGDLALVQTNLRFRDKDSLGIDILYFSSFFGGGDSSWSSSKNEHIDFDDFIVEKSFGKDLPTTTQTQNPPPQETNNNCTAGWKLTGYFTPLAVDYNGITQTITADGQQITAPSDFLTTIQLEGWGKLPDGRYIGYYDNAYHLSDIALDSQGNELHLNSVAVDTSVISHGEKFTFPNLPTPYNTRIYEATDIGSTVFGKHIDIFTGEGKQAEQETFKITRDSDELCLESENSVPRPESEDSIPRPSSSAKKVVAYFVEWGVYGRGYEVTDIPVDQVTHINYAFANIQNGKILIGDSYAALDRHLPTDSWAEPQETYYGNFRQLRLLKEANPDLKILISVGGWTWSSQFQSISSSAASRQVFSQSVLDFLEKYPFFDGVDIDWEFPVIGGLQAGLASDRDNFTVLMQSLRQTLGNERLLTIAVNAGPLGISALDYGAFAQYVDDINIMSYDLHGPWDGRTGHNSPLFNNNDPANVQFNVHSAVQNILAQGVPSEKIIIGMPFYGRSFAGVNSSTPLYAPSSGAAPGSFEAGVLDYKDIASDYLTDSSYEQHWDDIAQVPYLYSPSKNIFVSYDDPRSISNKAQYVVENNLGGVMFWELTSDNGDLVNAIHEGYNSSTSTTTSSLLFTDLPTNHPLTSTVTTAVTEGWINGYEDNTVGLEIPLNRAEFITMAMKAFDSPILPFDENFANMFSDNPADAWFSSNLYTAAKYELISGYSDGTVRPNETIILAEALRVILELKGGKNYSVTDPWFQSYWDEALASALVTDSQLPWDSMTRGDAIELISKVKTL